MDFGLLARRLGKLASANSPAILTAVGVTGTLTTAYLTGKATLKAAEIIAEEKSAHDEETCPKLFTLKGQIELTWKEYIPAAGSLVLTIACIVAANRIGANRLAAVATAYSIAEKATVRYKDKVIETVGKKKEEVIRTAIAQDEVSRHPIGSETVYVEGGGPDIFRDAWSGRYFNSTVERIDRAVNHVNHKINTEYSATLSDLYDLLGLEHTQESDYIGWNTDRLLDITYNWTSTPDERPCGVVWFNAEPNRGHNSFR